MDEALSGAFLCVKIINIDYYLWQPEHLSSDPGWLERFTPAQRGRSLPAVRIIGRTSAGSTVCLHLHNTFPRTYVPLPETVAHNPEAERRWTQRLRVALERALEQLHLQQRDQRQAPDANWSANQPGSGAATKAPSSVEDAAADRYIYDITIEWRRCIYGFKANAQRFARIRYVHPAESARLVQALASGMLAAVDDGTMDPVLPARLQPYEAHLPYVLQVMADYGLAGFGCIGLCSGRFRPPLASPRDAASEDADHGMQARHSASLVDNLPPDMVWNVPVKRQTDCHLEVDVWLPRDLHPAHLHGQQEPTDLERHVPSLRLIWESERRRRCLSSWRQMWVPIAHCRLEREVQPMDTGLKQRLGMVVSQALRKRAGAGNRQHQERRNAIALNDETSQADDLASALAAQFGCAVESSTAERLHPESDLEDEVLWNWMEQNYRTGVGAANGQPVDTSFASAYSLDTSVYEDEEQPVDEVATQKECADILDCSLPLNETPGLGAETAKVATSPASLVHRQDTELGLSPPCSPSVAPSRTPVPESVLASASELQPGHESEAVQAQASTTSRPRQASWCLAAFHLERSNVSPANWFMIPDQHPPFPFKSEWGVAQQKPFYSAIEDKAFTTSGSSVRWFPQTPLWREVACRAFSSDSAADAAGLQTWRTPLSLPPLPQHIERIERFRKRSRLLGASRKVIEVRMDSYGREVRTVAVLAAAKHAVSNSVTVTEDAQANARPASVGIKAETAPRSCRSPRSIELGTSPKAWRSPWTRASELVDAPESRSVAIETPASVDSVQQGAPRANREEELPALPADQAYGAASAAAPGPMEAACSSENGSASKWVSPELLSASSSADSQHTEWKATSDVDARRTTALPTQTDRNWQLHGVQASLDAYDTQVHSSSAHASEVRSTRSQVLDPSPYPNSDPSLAQSSEARCTNSQVLDPLPHPDSDLTLRRPAREPLSSAAAQRCRTFSDETGAMDPLPDTVAELEDDEAQLVPLVRPASPRYDEPSEFWSDAPHAAPAGSSAAIRSLRTDREKRSRGRLSDITGPSQISSGRDSSGISGEPAPLEPLALHHQYGTETFRVLAIESLSINRREQRPDALQDPLAAIGLVFRGDDSDADRHIMLVNSALRTNTGDDASAALTERTALGLVPTTGYTLQPTRVVVLGSEAALLRQLALLCRHLDPDILVSYSLRDGGIGYLLQRAGVLGYDLASGLSRVALGVHDPKTERQWSLSMHPWETDTASGGIRLLGRYVLDVWRIMQSEVKLSNYTFYRVVEEILGRRMPRLPWSTQRDWFKRGTAADCRRALELVLFRAAWTLDLLEALDILGRSAEMATSYGIDLLSVFLRGSQYRVESLMARLAHAQGYVLVSPTAAQVRCQPATAFIPLVMEPEARYYSDPVLVLDFQSLYPSMIIAHNICFSTCLGRVLLDSESDWRTFASGIPRVFGVLEAYSPDWIGLVEALATDATPDVEALLTVLPNQTVFVKPRVRHGILPLMLREILETRMMLKGGMEAIEKQHRTAPVPEAERLRLQAIYRMLNARQFAMKYIANVTYGYTSASFSGRMPCAEIADAIVSAGREAMERIVATVERLWGASHGARVVYGDTDSIFVLVPGASREVAFQLGRAMAEQCSALFPDPVRLKLEKVYSRSLLLAKKRYVGWAYESENQQMGMLDAKGIETVRRDSCGLVQKILERALRLLFTGDQDLSPIRRYVQRQLQRVLQNRFDFRDAIFFKEVQLGRYKPGYEPPAALVALRQLDQDPAAVPAFRERVPYVVIYGEPGSTLRELVVDPGQFLEARRQGRILRLNTQYYVRKQILPALERCFSLMGVDVFSWFQQVPRVAYRAPHSRGVPLGAHQKSGIEHYLPGFCAVCGESCAPQTEVCRVCLTRIPDSLAIVQRKLHTAQQRLFRLQELCLRCIGEGITASECRDRPGEPLSAGACLAPEQHHQHQSCWTQCWYPPCAHIECALLVERDKASLTTATYMHALGELSG